MDDEAIVSLHPIRRTWLVLAALLAAFCAGCAHSLASAYKPDAGPYRVQVASQVELDVPQSSRRLPVRIAWPAEGGPFPVVVFSHGGGSSKDMYDRMADHWASEGYVVILPTHMDSATTGFDMKAASAKQMLDVIESRRRDLSFIVDSLGTLQEKVPGLAGRIDTDRIVAAGHSLGGATALTVSGLVIQDPKTGERYGYLDDRFDALLLITEPGHSPVMPEDPWRAVPIPVFVATGSKDYSGQWQGPPKNRLYTFAPGLTLPLGIPHHYLFVENMDHYIGGLICRTDKGPPDPEALRIVNGASTAFLDAYTKNDRRALEFLESAKITTITGGRATLSVR